MSPTTIIVDAVLFDMDGTLVDSTAGVEGAWELFKEKYPDINIKDVLSTCHGIRTVETLRVKCKIEDPDELQREAERFEFAIAERAGSNGRKGIVALPGVREILHVLDAHSKLPKPLWAICTSATRAYAEKALKQAEITVPDVFVVAEDVKQGKPQPDPYLLGAKRCGVDPERCLVIEDAPNGVRSGKAAGSKTLALLTSHNREQVNASSPDFVVQDLASVTMKVVEGGVEVTMNTL